MESAFRNTWTCFLLAFMVLALSVGAFAQGGAGELTGLVTDSTGAVVSGVEVKLSNSATGEVRTTVTTPAGIYTFPSLPIVGAYTLEISAKGFKSTKVQNVVISVGTITSRDIKLEVGAATEQVTVEAGQQIVETEDSALSTLIDRRVWENMPLEARNANDFVNLVAGVVPSSKRAERSAARRSTVSGPAAAISWWKVLTTTNKARVAWPFAAQAAARAAPTPRYRRMRLKSIASSRTTSAPNTARSAGL